MLRWSVSSQPSIGGDTEAKCPANHYPMLPLELVNAIVQVAKTRQRNSKNANMHFSGIIPDVRSWVNSRNVSATKKQGENWPEYVYADHQLLDLATFSDPTRHFLQRSI